MKCPKCTKYLLCGGEHSYEDYGIEEEGIVGNYTCQNNDCDVDQVYVYTKI
jgi:hypothetical protein